MKSLLTQIQETMTEMNSSYEDNGGFLAFSDEDHEQFETYIREIGEVLNE